MKGQAGVLNDVRVDVAVRQEWGVASSLRHS